MPPFKLRFSALSQRLQHDVSATWLWVILGGHTAWGMYPVFARYLQVKSGLPTFALASAAQLVVFLGLLVFVLPRLSLRQLRARALWVFGGIVVLRSITNMLSVRYTLAVYVQTVNLLTPFLVVIINSGFFHQRAPRFTALALTLTLSGAAMMSLGEGLGGGTVFSLTARDLLGIAIAMASSFFLALYMISIGHIVDAGVEDKAVLFVQVSSLLLVMGVLSLALNEDMSAWSRLVPADWAAFFGFAFISGFGATWVQVQALKHVSTTLVSSAIAWRLVITSIGGFLMLGEQFVSVWQYLGAMIVVVTITWYLWGRVPSAAAD
jgi:drug/metabolite transporter (DMT)-like permease